MFLQFCFFLFYREKNTKKLRVDSRSVSTRSSGANQPDANISELAPLSY